MYLLSYVNFHSRTWFAGTNQKAQMWFCNRLKCAQNWPMISKPLTIGQRLKLVCENSTGKQIRPLSMYLQAMQNPGFELWCGYAEFAALERIPIPYLLFLVVCKKRKMVVERKYRTKHWIPLLQQMVDKSFACPFLHLPTLVIQLGFIIGHPLSMGQTPRNCLSSNQPYDRLNATRTIQKAPVRLLENFLLAILWFLLVNRFSFFTLCGRACSWSAIITPWCISKWWNKSTWGFTKQKFCPHINYILGNK